MADAHVTAHPARHRSGGHHAAAHGGRHAAPLGPDLVLAGAAPAGSAGGRLGVGHPHRAGSSRASSAPACRAAVRVGAPWAYPGGSLLGMSAGGLAWVVASAPVSVRGVAPGPGRAAWTPRHRWLPSPPNRGQQECPVTGAPRWAMSPLDFRVPLVGLEGAATPRPRGRGWRHGTPLMVTHRPRAEAEMAGLQHPRRGVSGGVQHPRLPVRSADVGQRRDDTSGRLG